MIDDRVKRLWAPTAATCACAMAALKLQQMLPIEPMMPFQWGRHAWVFYIPWLASLPVAKNREIKSARMAG
jgi:hypothetical protein